jgi:hypothetical protein
MASHQRDEGERLIASLKDKQEEVVYRRWLQLEEERLGSMSLDHRENWNHQWQ